MAVSTSNESTTAVVEATTVRPFRIDVLQRCPQFITEIDGLDIQFALPRRLRLRGDDEPEPTDDRLRPRRLARRDGRLLLRQVPPNGPTPAANPRRSSPTTRCSRHLPLLADQHGTSSSRSYWEGAHAGGGPFNAFDIPSLPVAITVFPAEIYRAPRSWGERAFGNLIYWNEVDKGGHFAAWEQPTLFSEQVRAVFRPLRDRRSS